MTETSLQGQPDPMVERTDKRRPVWDLPVRITHWLFVVLIGVSWWTGENGELQWHTWSGYALLTLLIFRVYWGVVGSSTARFQYFIRAPKTVWQYTTRLLTRPGKPVFGHNPLGGWSALLLLTLLLIQILLGLFSEDVDGLASGPLSYKVSYDVGRWAAETHEIFFNVVLVFIGLHIAAVLFYWLYKKTDLVTPMFTGKTTAVASEPTFIAPLWRIIPGLLVAGLFVWWLVG